MDQIGCDETEVNFIVLQYLLANQSYRVVEVGR